jgi:cytochrome c-type biogenesis protein CcmH
MPDRVRNVLAVVVLAASTVVTVAALASSDPSPQDRVAHLAARLKCPVCESESIADSPADIARDLQDLIAEQVADGWTDEEVVDFFIASYGEEVLLDPPSDGRSAILWIAPLVALAAGLAVILGRRARRPRDLDDAEERRVDDALRSLRDEP